MSWFSDNIYDGSHWADSDDDDAVAWWDARRLFGGRFSSSYEDDDDAPDPNDPDDERNYEGYDTDPGNKFGPSHDDDENPGSKFD